MKNRNSVTAGCLERLTASFGFSRDIHFKMASLDYIHLKI